MKLGGLNLIAGNCDDAYALTLRHALAEGHLCNQAGGNLSVGSGRESKEVLNLSIVVNSPQERLIYNSQRRLNLPAAVARFVWMMAASDRLADIAFYEPKVSYFSDNGISVPGSSYGQRILNPRPGLNQLEAVILRLKEDPFSRRAAISVYQAEDAIRNSKDIPCTFGLFYHLREGKLYSTTLMRSNNAFTLLPYNLFEFSLLAEVVARELGVALGALTHHAVSMHVYEQDYAASGKVVECWERGIERLADVGEIPSDPKPLQQIRELVVLEAALRHGSAGLGGTNIQEWIARGSEKLHPYWRQLYFLLLLHVAKKNDDWGALEALDIVIDEPWRSYLPQATFEASAPVASTVQELLDLELPPETYGKVVPIFSTRRFMSLRSRAAEWEAQGGSLGWSDYSQLQEHFLSTVAARYDEEVAQDEFENVLKRIQLK